MKEFIRELENANTMLCILTNETGFRFSFTAEIDDCEIMNNDIKIHTDNGMEVVLFRNPDNLIYDDEGYVFVYDKTEIYISFIQ